MAQKNDPCPPVHRLHDQPPQKGTGAGGARPQAARSASTPWARSRAAALTSARTRPVWQRPKRKRRWRRCFEQPVPAEVYDALAAQLADVEKEAQPNGEA